MASDAEKTDLQHPLIQDFAMVRIKEFLKTVALSLLVAGLAVGAGYLLDQKLGSGRISMFIFLGISYLVLQVYLFRRSRKVAASTLKKTT